MRFLTLCALSTLAFAAPLALAQPPTYSAPRGVPDVPWLGINASWNPNLRAHLNDMGVKAIRLNWGWIEAGKPDGFAPRYADPKKLREFVNDGFVLTVGLMPRGADLEGNTIEDPDFEKWVTNYKNYARQVMSRYGRKGDVLISSYLVGNPTSTRCRQRGFSRPINRFASPKRCGKPKWKSIRRFKCNRLRFRGPTCNICAI